jgi:hypothetical protein
MKWLTGAKGGTGRRLNYPDHPAVAVRIYLQHKTSQRVALLLSPLFVRALKLQPGDKLMIGVAENGSIGLVKHKDGNRISGKGFSETQPNSKSGDGKSTPYLSFNTSTYPELVEWATAHRNQWVAMQPTKNKIESNDVLHTVWVSETTDSTY